MDRLAGFFRPEISARRHQIVIVEMPDQRRPRIVEHPLNHARGSVLIPRVGLEHRALAIVSHGLGLALVIVQRRPWSVAPVQSIGKNVDCREPLPARVIIPNLVNRPKMLLGDEFLQRFPRRNRRPRTRLRVVAVSAACCSEADDTTGFGHCNSFSMSRYIFSTLAGGGLSLPFSHTNTLG